MHGIELQRQQASAINDRVHASTPATGLAVVVRTVAGMIPECVVVVKGARVTAATLLVRENTVPQSQSGGGLNGRGACSRLRAGLSAAAVLPRLAESDPRSWQISDAMHVALSPPRPADGNLSQASITVAQT